MKTKKSIARENMLKFMFSNCFSKNLDYNNFLKNFGFSRKGINHLEKLIEINNSKSNLIEEKINKILKLKSINSINKIELILLKISFMEKELSTPKKVIINEILILSEKYGETKSYKVLNRILDEAL